MYQARSGVFIVHRSLSTVARYTRMPSTPVLPCSAGSIEYHPTPSPAHPLQRPTFEVPPELRSHVETAAAHLKAGRTVAVPTETVYGLAANSLNPDAVNLIYKIKNRPSDNPLIIHVSSLDMLMTLLPADYTLSRLYMALISAFWPGPLTLLFPSPSPPPPPAPQTNAIRMPNHPLALALISHANLPLSAPSANSSGRPSPTRAKDVVNDLDGAEGLGCILDGGDCGVGVESTVVDALAWKEGGGGSVNVLRPGGLGVEAIQRVVDQVDGQEGMTEIRVHGKRWMGSQGGINGYTSHHSVNGSIDKLGESSKSYPSTPGMKYRHYSPRIPVYLLLPSTSFPRPPTSPVTERSSLATVVDEAAPSNDRYAISTVLRHLARRHPSRVKFGLLHYDSSPLFRAIQGIPEADRTTWDIQHISLGADATSAARRLFSGLLDLEDRVQGVDAILVEGCTDDGLGLAVMERVGKAVGGSGLAGDVGVDEDLAQAGEAGRYWIQL